AEGDPFSDDHFAAMLSLAKEGCATLSAQQSEISG
ncbi:MAG: ribonuclease PH, partial [Marinicaulis sp.]|nr:ribonuclease PH [Marinicaulis sp.]